jgi:hypothetical protein
MWLWAVTIAMSVGFVAIALTMVPEKYRATLER